MQLERTGKAVLRPGLRRRRHLGAAASALVLVLAEAGCSHADQHPAPPPLDEKSQGERDRAVADCVARGFAKPWCEERIDAAFRARKK